MIPNTDVFYERLIILYRWFFFSTRVTLYCQSAEKWLLCNGKQYYLPNIRTSVAGFPPPTGICRPTKRKFVKCTSLRIRLYIIFYSYNIPSLTRRRSLTNLCCCRAMTMLRANNIVSIAVQALVGIISIILILKIPPRSPRPKHNRGVARRYARRRDDG